jgi:Na+/H+ antiporter NhaD/arsenite permease-like protein
MLLPIIIFCITYLFIVTEKVDKTIAALLGAAAVIMLHVIPSEEALIKVDLNVIFLLIGMMIIVTVLSETGVFEWVAIKTAQIARGNGLIITLLFVTTTAVFSAFLDNVTTVILIAPITILIAQILEIPVVPLLILESIFSNIGGTATLVGDPPNILIGSQTNLSFNDFIINLGPVIAVVLLAGVALVALVYRSKLKTTPTARERITTARPERAILEPVKLKRSMIIFGLILLGFFLGRLMDWEPGIVALAGGLVMILVTRSDLHQVMRKVEWGTILFFAGLFMLVGALEFNGIFERLGSLVLTLCSGHLLLTAITILWFSAITSAIVDNIPLVMAMIPLVKSIIPAFATQMGLSDPAMIHSQIESPLFWALALGACLGGNGTLVGASANVVVAQIARRNAYSLTFWNFTRQGLPYMFMSLIISTVYIYLRYFIHM